jgi:hypothetical protein
LNGEQKDVDMQAIDPENDYRIRDRITDDAQYREALRQANIDRLTREEIAKDSLPSAVGRQKSTLLDVGIQAVFMVIAAAAIAYCYKIVVSPRTRPSTRIALLFTPVVLAGLFVLFLLAGDKPKTIRFHGDEVYLLGPANDISLRVYGVCSPAVSKYHRDRMQLLGTTGVSVWSPRRDAWSIYSIGEDRFRMIGSVSSSGGGKFEYVCDAQIGSNGTVHVTSVFPVSKDSEDLADFRPIIEYFERHPEQAIPWGTR